MKKNVAMKWVEALRSGRYRQANGCLKRDKRTFCCLGVLQECVLGIPITSDEDDGCLYEAAQKKAGMRTDIGALEARPGDSFSEYLSLADANDSGVRFPRIADWIEQNYEKL